jgi:hypothetical protein
VALNVCTALRVVGVAEDPGALDQLKRAAVSAEWELAPGSTDEDDALRQVREENVHVAVVFGSFEGFVRRALGSVPTLRIVSDRPLPGASVVVASLDEVRSAVLGVPRPGGG